MRRYLIIFIFLIQPIYAAPGQAQERAGIFADYAAYAAFVDEKIMSRDFVPLILFLGGSDEFSADQLTDINANLLNAFPANFENVTIFREVGLGGGIFQEARAYWNDDNYAFFYAVLHRRGSEIVVLNFGLNSNLQRVLEMF